MAIGYNMPGNVSELTLRVANSLFNNNSANAAPIVQTSTQTVNKTIFIGRGGSMAVYCNAYHHNISVIITDSVYKNNFARSYGGGLYFGITEKDDSSYSPNEIVIEKTIFASNTAGLGGGGLVLFNIEAKVTDCNITNNTAIAGGGIFVSTPLGCKQICGACTITAMVSHIVCVQKTFQRISASALNLT